MGESCKKIRELFNKYWSKVDFALYNPSENMVIGAVFKFYSELDEKRAPVWVRKMKLEFAYRILQEPKKQLSRCWKIVTTIPRMLWEEGRRAKSR